MGRRDEVGGGRQRPPVVARVTTVTKDGRAFRRYVCGKPGCSLTLVERPADDPPASPSRCPACGTANTMPAGGQATA